MLFAYFLAVFEPRNLAVLAGSLLCAVAVVATVEPAYLPWQVNHGISKVIHVSYLIHLKFGKNHTESGGRET